MNFLELLDGQFDGMSDGDFGDLPNSPSTSFTLSPTAPTFTFKYNWFEGRSNLSGVEVLSASSVKYLDAVVPHDLMQEPITFKLPINVAALTAMYIVSTAALIVMFYASDGITHTDLAFGSQQPYVFTGDMYPLSAIGTNGLVHDVDHVSVIPNVSEDATVRFRVLVESLITILTP